MDNDDAPVGSILSRREAMRLAGRAGLGVVLGRLIIPHSEAAAQAAIHQSVKLVAAPELTEGPFYVDEKLNRSNLIGTSSRDSVRNGLPLELTVSVYKLENGKYSPLTGAAVDLWHCDAHGVYSDINQEMNHEDTAGQKWLRGTQVSDGSGQVKFETIFPGWYESRTTHIHFKVRQPHSDQHKKEFTSQLFFEDHFSDQIYKNAPYRVRGADGVRNHQDNIFCQPQVDGTQAGRYLMPDIKSTGKGVSAHYAIALTDGSFQPRRPGPGGPPPGDFGPPPDWNQV